MLFVRIFDISNYMFYAVTYNYYLDNHKEYTTDISSRKADNHIIRAISKPIYYGDPLDNISPRSDARIRKDISSQYIGLCMYN